MRRGELPLLGLLLGLACSSSPSPKLSTYRASSPLPRGLDCHMHRPDGDGDGTRRELFAGLDAAHLGRGCVLSRGYHPAPGCTDQTCAAQPAFTTAENDAIVALAKTSNQRLLPFCGIPITMAGAANEVDRCAAIGARGLKLHLVAEKVLLGGANTVPATRLREVFARAGKHKLPVLIHVHMSNAAEIRAFFTLVADAPTTTVIAAHQLAPSLALLSEAPPNLWIEVSGLTHAPVAAGELFVAAWRAFGVDKVLLGSDFPSLSPAEHVKLLKQYPLTDDERAKILNGNGARLFPSR